MRLVKTSEWPYDTALFPSKIRSLHGQHRISQKALATERKTASTQREPALGAAYGGEEREESDRSRRQGGRPGRAPERREHDRQDRRQEHHPQEQSGAA